jgi:hypothetical protein
MDMEMLGCFRRHCNFYFVNTRKCIIKCDHIDTPLADEFRMVLVLLLMYAEWFENYVSAP